MAKLIAVHVYNLVACSSCKAVIADLDAKKCPVCDAFFDSLDSNLVKR